MFKPAIRFVVFIAGSCNLIYELCLSQIASSFLGGTLYQYALNIGIFIMSMGAGSLLAEKLPENSIKSTLVKIEVVLFLIAITMPFYIVFAEKHLSAWPFHILLWLTNISIGALSGLELPLFNRALKSVDSTSEVLFADYLGMFCGSLAFSFLLFPLMGVFGTLWAAALLNLLALGFLQAAFRSFSVRSVLFSIIGAGVVLTALVFTSELSGILQRFYVS